jgi:hypothetical protein
MRVLLRLLTATALVFSFTALTGTVAGAQSRSSASPPPTNSRPVYYRSNSGGYGDYYYGGYGYDHAGGNPGGPG